MEDEDYEDVVDRLPSCLGLLGCMALAVLCWLVLVGVAWLAFTAW